MSELSPDALAAYATLSPESKAAVAPAMKSAGYNVEAQGFAAVGNALAADDYDGMKTALEARGYDLADLGETSREGQINAMRIQLAAIQGSTAAAKLATDDMGVTGGPTVAGLQAEAAKATAAILAPPKESYRLAHSNAGSLTSDELVAQDNLFKAGYSAMGLPASMVQSVHDSLLATAERYSLPNATEADFKSAFMDEGAIIAGMSNSKEIIRLSQVAQDAMPAEFKASLSSKFAMHSAQSIVALSNVGLLLELKARGGKR